MTISFDGKNLVKWFFEDDVGSTLSVVDDFIGELKSDKDFLWTGNSSLIKRVDGKLMLQTLFTKQELPLDFPFILNVAEQWRNFVKSLPQH